MTQAIDFKCQTDLTDLCDSYHSCANVCMDPVLDTGDTDSDRRLDEVKPQNGNIDDIPECFLFNDNTTTDHEADDKFDAGKLKCVANDDLSKLFKYYPKYSLTYTEGSDSNFTNNSDSVYVDKGSGQFDKKADRDCKDIDMLQTLNFRVYPSNVAVADITDNPKKYNPGVYDAAELSDKNWYYNQTAGIISSFGAYFHMPTDISPDLKAYITSYYTTGDGDDEDAIGVITTSGRYTNISDLAKVVPSGQFARSFCWAHGCDYDQSVEVVYYYDKAKEAASSLKDDDGETKVAHKFGLPIYKYESTYPVFTQDSSAKVCRDFNNNSNSTASIMQFGIVLATAFYALLI